MAFKQERTTYHSYHGSQREAAEAASAESQKKNSASQDTDRAYSAAHRVANSNKVNAANDVLDEIDDTLAAVEESGGREIKPIVVWAVGAIASSPEPRAA